MDTIGSNVTTVKLAVKALWCWVW